MQLEQMNNEELVIKVQEGDIEAMNVLFTNCLGYINGEIIKHTYLDDDYFEREEKTAIAYEKFVESAKKYENLGKAQFTTFMCTSISRGLQRYIFNQKPRWTKADLILNDSIVKGADTELVDLMPCPNNDYEELERIDLIAPLEGLIEQLTDKHEDVILKYYFKEMTTPAIGAELGLVPSAINYRLKCAIKELQKLYFRNNSKMEGELSVWRGVS